MTLGGNICIRNGFELDYCWREAIQSLLPVCDEVVVCDGGSTDGTREHIVEWAEREPKIKLVDYPWPNPKGDIKFWTDWLNFAREHIKCDFQIQLDADEVLSENSYDWIKSYKHCTEAGKHESLWCKRWNFWRDAQSLIPYGHCLSNRVCRIAPQGVWLPSDGADERGWRATALAQDSGIEIFHYGFIRKRESFFKKARALQEMFFNSYDPRLEEVEKVDGNWMVNISEVEWTTQLVPFEGKHPMIMEKWLTERGCKI